MEKFREAFGVEAKDDFLRGVSIWGEHQASGWPQITKSLEELIRLGAYDHPQLMKIVEDCREGLRLTSQRVVDLDVSIKNWTKNRKCADPSGAVLRGADLTGRS